MKYKKIIRISIIIISILASYLLYESEYNIKSESRDIEKGIEEFLDEEVTIVDYMKVDNTLAVYYTMSSMDSIGFTALHKGINSKYQIRNAGYSTRNSVISGIPFKTNKGEYIAILGTNFDNKIARIKFKTYSNEIFSASVQDELDILIAFKVKLDSYVESYQLYDKNGNDITEDMKVYINTKESNSMGKGKAEIEFLYVFCFIIILIGYGISRIFKDENYDKLKSGEDDFSIR